MRKKRDKSWPLLFLGLLIIIGSWLISLSWVINSYQEIIREIRTPVFRPKLKESRIVDSESRIEEEGKETVKPPKVVSAEKPPPKVSKGKRIAIILDDAGYSLSPEALELVEEGWPITVSIFPFLSCSKKIAEVVKENNGEVMLHLPMEASQPTNLKGTILLEMKEEEIREDVRSAIKAIPNLLGVNNHMGSKATADQKTMSAVLSEIKEHNLYFVDSVTTEKSCAAKTAKRMGLKTGVRNVFLDNEDNIEYVAKQFELLLEMARKNGEAIAIGHITKKSTVSFLKKEIPKLTEAGYELVRVSEMVK
ncbi:divergent polysaccharide deacetylase family protein [bacterium]|nr:divergent polysaccharide deacetylase family protein [bacterium]MBU1599710.1 divergent polysaccharide deacetylase family protein [bacterium]